MADPLLDLTRAGVAIWLDDLSRARLADGSLVRLIRDAHVVGVTTNPTNFRKAISSSDHYDRQVRDLAAQGVDAEEVLRMITTRDVAWACDLLRPAYDSSQGVDGRVSIEVDPRLAHDTEETVAEARQLWWLVDRPIFSRRRYAEVMDAFVAGIERARTAGHDLTRLASVASFFVSRVDTEIDQRLDAIGSAEAKALRGTAAIADARLAFQASDEVFTSDRWHKPAQAGARPQCPLWASTGVKDPAYDDTRYVLDLVTSGVVNTMPEATLRAVADHGTVRGDTIRRGYDGAAEVMAALAAAVGVDYDDVVDTLEQDDLTTFRESWAALAETLRRTLMAAKRGRNEDDLP